MPFLLLENVLDYDVTHSHLRAIMLASDWSFAFRFRKAFFITTDPFKYTLETISPHIQKSLLSNGKNNKKLFPFFPKLVGNVNEHRIRFIFAHSLSSYPCLAVRTVSLLPQCAKKLCATSSYLWQSQLGSNRKNNKFVKKLQIR